MNFVVLRQKEYKHIYVFLDSENLIANCIYLMQREIQQSELKPTIAKINRLWGHLINL